MFKDEGCSNPCSSKNAKWLNFISISCGVQYGYHSSTVSSFIDHRTNVKKCVKPYTYRRPVFLLHFNIAAYQTPVDIDILQTSFYNNIKAQRGNKLNGVFAV